MSALEGVLEKVTFYNEETLFMVARLRSEESGLVTVVGNLPPISRGERLRVWGEWGNHPLYGRQYKVDKYEVVMPVSSKGILRFLASGLLKGVGPSTAEKLVEAFGNNALEVIEKEPQRLTSVEGIGKKKAAMIAAGLQERQDIVKTMTFLQGYGVGPGYAARIFRSYGAEAENKIREDPYRLAEDVFGVGFHTADKIALEMGIPVDAPQRIRAALLFTLRRASDEGHVCLPQTELEKRVLSYLRGEENGMPAEAVTVQAERLADMGSLVMEETPAGETVVYLKPLYQAEIKSAETLKQILSQPVAELEMADWSEKITSTLSQGQREAVLKAMREGLLVVTGGPGTGKTTTIKTLLMIFQQHGLEVMLAAPTGRAAKRMTEASGVEACTIHRLLEYTYTEESGYSFQRNGDRPLKAHVLIVDEVSMVDIVLFYHLLEAVPSGCRLIMVGDMDQLPSVGPGNVLRDLINSGVIPVERLTQIFRQAEMSSIVVNAHKINAGKMPQLRGEKDFHFINEGDPEKIVELILGLCAGRLPRFMNIDPIDDIQVLSPMRRYILGADNLNLRLQERLNPPVASKTEMRVAGGRFIRLGDKVMQVRNNYQKEVFNGDVGRVMHISNEEGEVYVRYPEIGGFREIIYDQTDLDELVLSYAVSVHKSQGSEYPVVVMPMVTQHYVLLQRNLLYTAVTRAREAVVLVGTTKALGIAVRNNTVEARYTRLAELLAGN